MEVTREWLNKVSDEHGLTTGQQVLLNIHCGLPYVGKLLDEKIVHAVEMCKGYRGLSQSIRDLK